MAKNHALIASRVRDRPFQGRSEWSSVFRRRAPSHVWLVRRNNLPQRRDEAWSARESTSPCRAASPSTPAMLSSCQYYQNDHLKKILKRKPSKQLINSERMYCVLANHRSVSAAASQAVTDRWSLLLQGWTTTKSCYFLRSTPSSLATRCQGDAFPGLTMTY